MGILSRLLLFVWMFGLLLLTGCGGGSSEGVERANADNVPPGAVLQPDGSWGYPPPSDEGYDRESVDAAGDDYDDYEDDEEDAVPDEQPYEEEDEDPQPGGKVREGLARKIYGDPDEGIGPPPDRNRGYDDAYSAGAYAKSSDNEPSPYSDEMEDDESDDSDADGSGYSSDGGYADAGGGSDGSGVYAEQIKPLLRARCYNCHGGGPRGKKGDVELHSPETIRDFVTAFRPDDSELLYRIELSDGSEGKMPPEGPRLTKAEIATVRNWIQSGAQFEGGGANDPYGQGGGGYGRRDDGDRDDGGDSPYDDEGDESSRQAAGPPKNLAEAASRSWQDGADRTAINQLYAQTLLADEVAKQVFDQYQYAPGLRRPKLAVRWGVGIDFEVRGGSFKGAPRPIGVDQDLPRLEKDNDNSDDSEVGSEFSNQQLDYYTGDYGDELLLRLEMRLDRGYYGHVLKAALSSQRSGSGDEDEYGDDSGGGYGSGYGSGYGGGGYGGRDSGSSSGERPDDQQEQIMPGVVMLGTASPGVLQKRAEQQQVDALLVFDVSIEANRRLRLVRNTTRVRLFDVASGEMLIAAKPLVNIDVQRKRATDPEYAPVIEQMDRIFKVADEKYRVRDYPANATAKHAKGFVMQMLKLPAPNPLWKLAELRFYQHRGLLTAKEVASVDKRVAPEQAAALAAGVDEDKVRELFGEFLVEDEPEDSGDSERDDESFDDEEDDGRDRRPERRRDFR